MVRFIHLVPVFRLLAAFISGSLLFSSNPKLALSVLIVGIFGCLLFQYLQLKVASVWNVRWMPGLFFGCIWVSLGALASAHEDRKSLFPCGAIHGISALGKVESPPEEKGRTLRFRVCLLQSDDENWTGKRVMVRVPKTGESRRIEVGDCLLMAVTPCIPEPFTTAGSFDYVSWLHRQGICAVAYLSPRQWTVYAKAPWFDLNATIERLRMFFTQGFRRAGMDGELYSLVSALVLGCSGFLTEETKQCFSMAGVSHVLSVSGLHVAAVYAAMEFLFSFFSFFGKWKWFRQVILVLVLWLYALMTGLSPCVVRASLMLSLVAVGKSLHRRTHPINTVLFSAFVLLFWKPSLWFDVGFELSYAAVVALVVLYPKLVSVWHPHSVLTSFFWKTTCLSLVAQLGTAPLTVYYFHQFPTYFLLSNLVAVPISGLIVYLALVHLIMGGLPYVGTVLTWFLKVCLSGFLWFVKATSALPYAATKDIQFDVLEVWVSYVLIAAFFVYFLEGKRKWVFVFISGILFLQIRCICCI